MSDAPVKGSLGSTSFQLAHWLDPDERYQRRYVPVDPEGGVVSDQPGLHADSKVRLWVIRAWSGGEGEDLWTREDKTYRRSDGVTLVNLGEGLQLARLSGASQQAAGGDFQDGRRFGLGLGGLWTVEDGAGYVWDRSNEEWASGVTTGAGTSNATSLTDGDDTWIYSGHENGGIHRWKSGSNEEHYANSGSGDDFTYAPIVRSWGGRLFALDGDYLYEIDKVTADTRTIRADPPGSSAVYLADTPWCYNRMSLSDKGPIWLQRLDNGQTLIHEYNVANDAHAVIGKLAVDFAFPYSIFFTQGFVFIGFRYANDHDQAGVAHVQFSRGAQRGVAGPFRSPTGVTASKPVLIGGQIGDDLIVYFDTYVWAYNLTDTGIRMIGEETLSGGPPEDFITFGQDIFAGPYASNEVERFVADAYVASGTLDSGRHDFDYPGLVKLLADVGVVTDPLPASTQVNVSVAWDGESFTALAGDHDGNGDRRFTWAASTPGADKTGNELEIRVTLATSASANTPTVRQIWATATGASHRIEWVLAVDCSKFSHQDIDNMNALIGQTLTFSDPFQNRGSDAPDSFVVTVEDVITPDLLRQSSVEFVHALVRCQSRDLVGVLGAV